MFFPLELQTVLIFTLRTETVKHAFYSFLFLPLFAFVLFRPRAQKVLAVST